MVLMRRWTSTVETTNDFGVNVEADVGISKVDVGIRKVLNKFLKVDFDVGGQFERVKFQRTSWKIEVDFGEFPALQM